jgi:predicted enzyme related to lactoylglutathione lyase
LGVHSGRVTQQQQRRYKSGQNHAARFGLHIASTTKKANELSSKKDNFCIAKKGGPMGNPFVHVELMTNDVRKAKEFYGKLFKWELEDVPMEAGPYTMIKVGEGTGGGMLKNPIPGAPSSWLAYVLVDDIDAATAKAKQLGASIMKDVSEVPNFGWFSVITDPTGATLALWEPKPRA